MTILILFYSRTGTTKKVANLISENLNCDNEEIFDTKNRKGFFGYIKSAKDAMRKNLTILEKIDKLPGEQIAMLLERLQDDILEKKGFSAILTQIRKGIDPLKRNMNLLNNTKKEELKSKMNFWRSKLKL